MIHDEAATWAPEYQRIGAELANELIRQAVAIEDGEPKEHQSARAVTLLMSVIIGVLLQCVEDGGDELIVDHMTDHLLKTLPKLREIMAAAA